MMLTENPEEEQIDANILKATMVLDIHWVVTKVREHILQWLKRSGDTGPSIRGSKLTCSLFKRLASYLR